jgi:hypothetical protein
MTGVDAMSADPGRRGWRAFAAVAVVATAMRVVVAVQPGLWCDEIFSLAMATGHSLEHPAALADAARGDFVEPRGAEPAAAFRRYLVHESPPAGFGRVLRAVLLSDTSPPLYYLVLDLWQRAFGSSDAALRFLSTVCALLALPLLWSVGYALGGRRVALLATLLFTLAPPALYYSAEGRMYALTWLLGLALARVTLVLARDGARPAVVLAWIGLAASGLLTHYFFAFVWLAMTAWLLLYGGPLRPWTTFGMAAMVGVLILPWYAQVPASLAGWRVTGRWLDTPLGPAQLAYGVLRLGGSLVNGYGVWRGMKLTMVVQAALILVLLLALARHGVRALGSRERRLALFWLAASVVGPVVLDALRATATSRIERYALPGLPAAMLVFALALDHVFRPAGAVVLIGTLIAWLPGLREVARTPPRYWEPFPVIAEHLDGWTEPDDLVIVSSIPSGVLGVARYVDPRTPIASWVVALGERRMPADAEMLTADRCRVALVRAHDLGERAPIEAWLRERAETTRELTLYDEVGVQCVITYFTLPGRDGRCASRRSASRTPAPSDPGMPRRPAERSAG